MKITTLPFAGSVLPKDINDKAVVVIDVLRATSTIITALMHGAKQIIPVVDIKNAFDLKKQYSPGEVLLCGERDARIIPDFDLGNSPLEYTTEKVQGKTLIVSTTNGTKTIGAVGQAKELLLASFINAGAIAKQFQNQQEMVLFCSGTNGYFSIDDAFCAGYIASLIEKTTAIEACDLTRTLIIAWENSIEQYSSIIKNCFHGKYLISKGFEQDVDYCLQINLTEMIPCYDSHSQSISILRQATY